mmetsp:Transcript_25444/g.56263  ORF Transcript_25444/g.56263 Transcript_25444/m.56263 type:complete len:91 (-) Transcript_25444:40-312(-)
MRLPYLAICKTLMILSVLRGPLAQESPFKFQTSDPAQNKCLKNEGLRALQILLPKRAKAVENLDLCLSSSCRGQAHLVCNESYVNLSGKV